MKIEDIDVDAAINSVRTLLQEEKDLSPALRSSLEVLIVLVTLLFNRITLNSRNSSKPPSSDPNREKISRQGKSDRKPGGQKGHNGTTLEAVDDPDEVTELKIDRRTLPKGAVYREAGYEIRQVIDIDLSRFVTEYRAQILEDGQGADAGGWQFQQARFGYRRKMLAIDAAQDIGAWAFRRRVGGHI